MNDVRLVITERMRRQIYVRHMLDAARKATDFARGRTSADLGSDEILALALVRLLEVMGEAARSVA